ncbi:MAG: hypothetical protein ACXVXD_10995 [Nocardioidaceae bacterium]
MSRRGVLLAVLAWLGTVAVTSALTWTVIRAAGADVLARSHALPSLAPAAVGRLPVRPAHPTPAPSPQASGSPHAPVRVRTWQGGSGSVVARCVGTGITLVAATPADGWAVAVGSWGPRRVEVVFRQAPVEQHITSVCATGVPRFGTERVAADPAGPEE